METPTQGTESEQKTDLAPAHRNTWAAVAGLPCVLSVELPVPGITIANLLELEEGSVIDSRQFAQRSSFSRVTSIHLSNRLHSVATNPRWLGDSSAPNGV